MHDLKIRNVNRYINIGHLNSSEFYGVILEKKRIIVMIEISICQEFQYSPSRTELSAPTTIGSDLTSDPPAAPTNTAHFPPPLSHPPRRSVYTKVLLSRCVSDPLSHARPTSAWRRVACPSPYTPCETGEMRRYSERWFFEQYTPLHNILRGWCHFRFRVWRERGKTCKHVSGNVWSHILRTDETMS